MTSEGAKGWPCMDGLHYWLLIHKQIATSLVKVGSG